MCTDLNVADRLSQHATHAPESLAVVAPGSGRSTWPSLVGNSGTTYNTITFGELGRLADCWARGLVAMGIEPRMRITLLVPAGIEMVALVFALLKAAATIVLIDPGLGKKHLLKCLSEVNPDGFVAISRAHAIRQLLSQRFPKARYNVTVGRRWFWRGETLKSLEQLGQTSGAALPQTKGEDPAAIIFTSGSTGPPKGVLYTQQMFDTQVELIQSEYDIQPGGIDLACFPLFALFNSAMGVTTVFPEMDFSRPATAIPQKLLAAANDWQITQSFASPAVWDKLRQHQLRDGLRIPTLKKIFSCGAPVPARLLESTVQLIAPEAKMHTPYGATECLPVATIERAEVIEQTSRQTDSGSGICVGRRFDATEWQVVRITDEPLASIEQAEPIPEGEIGELIVRGQQASPRYITGEMATEMAKIRDGEGFWHRMGDVGYLDQEQRFWYCGRKSHRVETGGRTVYTIPVEAILNTHPMVKRTALVGVGPRQQQTPVVVFETGSRSPEARQQVSKELAELARQHEITQLIQHFLPYKKLPVDVRHNAKINRELLACWAAGQLKSHLS